MNSVKKESNITYLDDVSTNPLDINNVPVNSVNVNVTNNGVPINQRTNRVNKEKGLLLVILGFIRLSSVYFLVKLILSWFYLVNLG